MPVYAPITNVTPLASMVTGFPVTAALGDQMRDNTVALYQGWWFRVLRSTTQSIGASSNTTVVFDTIIQSVTSVDDLSITLAAGVVTTRRPGFWMIGGHITLTAVTSGTLLLSLQSTDSPGGYAAQTINDTGNDKSAASVSITTEVTTTPNVFSLDVFNTSSCIVNTGQATAMYGVWLGDN